MNQALINWPPSGRYILAISGGADSMALLDLMATAATERGYELVVAHVDHGLRPGSASDRQFVQAAAARYGLTFEYHEARLGQGSEATARTARHGWLQKVRASRQSDAIVTAHHQDDLLETSLLNLVRGTGRRGLAPMQSGPILRPLLGLSRASLQDYALSRKIDWREDPTNAETTTPRNFLRHKMLPHSTPEWRFRYLELIQKIAQLNKKVAQSFNALLDSHKQDELTYTFPRELVQNLSLTELEELLIACALRLRPDIELDRRLVQELALFAKTASPHRTRPIRNDLQITVQPRDVLVYYMGISGSR